jgi:hypothetical protein
MQEAEQKIDSLAASGQIDPAFLFTMAKAYSGVKETDYTRDDVKETMHHLYMKAKEAAAKDAPNEVRILKHLLSVEDPRHRSSELEKAFDVVRFCCILKLLFEQTGFKRLLNRGSHHKVLKDKICTCLFQIVPRQVSARHWQERRMRCLPEQQPPSRLWQPTHFSRNGCKQAQRCKGKSCVIQRDAPELKVLCATLR